MSRIFISYRRDDSLGHVGWLRSLLIQRFGVDQIFRDIETIPPGVDFVEAIETAVGSCDVLLAVIGPRWLITTDRRGERRLDDPEDFVRIEIATALERNIRVIPVLVQDAHMPRSNELPSDIAKLARRNSIELRDSSWEYDVGRLGDALESVLQAQAPANQAVQRSDQQPHSAQQIDVLVAQLLEAEEQENWDTVINIGEQILKLDPNHESTRSKTAEAYRNCGIAYSEQGNPEEAIVHYEQALKLNPDFAAAYANRGFVRYRQGNFKRALEDCEQALKLDPSLSLAYNNRGIVWYAQGNFKRALEDYEQAIKLDPNSSRTYNNRGLVRFEQGDLQGALADYDRAIKLDPTRFKVYNNRGLVHYKHGDWSEAIKDYDQVLKVDPNFAIAYYNRGRAHLKQGNRAAAREDFEHAAVLGHEEAKKKLSEV